METTLLFQEPAARKRLQTKQSKHDRIVQKIKDHLLLQMHPPAEKHIHAEFTSPLTDDIVAELRLWAERQGGWKLTYSADPRPQIDLAHMYDDVSTAAWYIDDDHDDADDMWS